MHNIDPADLPAILRSLTVDVRTVRALRFTPRAFHEQDSRACGELIDPRDRATFGEWGHAA